MKLRILEVKLSLRKRAKDKILCFRAIWNSRNFWVFVSFWHIFWLQVALKTFLWVIWWCSGYLKGFPRQGFSSARRIMTVRLTIHLLLRKVLTPPHLLLVLDHASFHDLPFHLWVQCEARALYVVRAPTYARVQYMKSFLFVVRKCLQSSKTSKNITRSQQRTIFFKNLRFSFWTQNMMKIRNFKTFFSNWPKMLKSALCAPRWFPMCSGRSKYPWDILWASDKELRFFGHISAVLCPNIIDLRMCGAPL